MCVVCYGVVCELKVALQRFPQDVLHLLDDLLDLMFHLLGFIWTRGTDIGSSTQILQAGAIGLSHPKQHHIFNVKGERACIYVGHTTLTF